MSPVLGVGTEKDGDGNAVGTGREHMPNFPCKLNGGKCLQIALNYLQGTFKEYLWPDLLLDI